MVHFIYYAVRLLTNMKKLVEWKHRPTENRNGMSTERINSVFFHEAFIFWEGFNKFGTEPTWNLTSLKPFNFPNIAWSFLKKDSYKNDSSEIWCLSNLVHSKYHSEKDSHFKSCVLKYHSSRCKLFQGIHFFTREEESD